MRQLAWTESNCSLMYWPKQLSNYSLLTTVLILPGCPLMPKQFGYHSDHQTRTWYHEERVKKFPALACSIHCLYFTPLALLKNGVDFTQSQLDNKGRAVKGTFKNVALIGIISSPWPASLVCIQDFLLLLKRVLWV